MSLLETIVVFINIYNMLFAMEAFGYVMKLGVQGGSVLEINKSENRPTNEYEV